jgi:hypothetical protein
MKKILEKKETMPAVTAKQALMFSPACWKRPAFVGVRLPLLATANCRATQAAVAARLRF